MANFYPYLVSSLPMLTFRMPLPFSREKFFRLCADSVPEADLKIIESASINPVDYSCAEAHTGLSFKARYCEERNATLRQWFSFDTALRNELVKLRALRRHIEASDHLRTDSFADSDMVHTAIHAARNPSVLEGEVTLDEARWRFLENLSLGHYFDLELLVIYTLKLLLLEKWEKVRRANNIQLAEETLTGIKT